jgi:flagellum-specific ATP synthase
MAPGGGIVEAEVVGFSGEKLFMMPTDNVSGLFPGALVRPVETTYPQLIPGQRVSPRRRSSDRAKHLPVGETLLGRVVDGAGRPLDSLGPIHAEETRSLQGRPINPLNRSPIREPLDVGIRAINGLLTVGRGQRLGLFAGSGVGKSVLIGMMARYTGADLIVVGLIGERGREVKEFIEQNLGGEGLQRSVVVAAPADTSPLMRLQGAAYATTIAEYFRDQGKQVLLVMDSLTRFAMAQREIALAIGEPPVTRGYPPSVFALLPALVERAGNGPENGGSITAFYTVLAEGDDQQDPIADSARAILDGHIVLTRALADQGHYPAIDIEQSISRAMNNLISEQEFDRVRQFKQLFSRYQRSRDLIAVGAYQPGGDLLLDNAVAMYPRLETYLQQRVEERENYPGSRGKLNELFG